MDKKNVRVEMQLSEQQFCADWVARMGKLTPLTTATVLQYLNLRAQADAQPVAWMHEERQSSVISAAQKERALEVDGAYAASVQGYSIALAVPAAPELPEDPTVALLEAIAGKPWAMCGNGMQDDARARYAALRRAMGAPTATVAEPSKQAHMNELARASAAGQAEGIKLGIAMQKDRQGILSAVDADEAFKAVARHAGDICEWEEGLMRNAWDAALEFAAQQAEPTVKQSLTVEQAEPGADERAAFERWAKQEFDLRADGLTRRGDEYKYSAICDAWAAWQARAAQSGQRASNLSEATIQALWDEACNDSPQNPGWCRHIRFARAIEQAGQRPRVKNFAVAAAAIGESHE